MAVGLQYANLVFVLPHHELHCHGLQCLLVVAGCEGGVVERVCYFYWGCEKLWVLGDVEHQYCAAVFVGVVSPHEYVVEVVREAQHSVAVRLL